MNLSLLLSEIKVRRKTLLIWIGVWSIVGFLLAFMFDSFKDSQESFDQFIEALPPSVLEIVNIRAGYTSQVESFLSGQFLSLYLLLGSIFASFFGSSLLAGRIADKTLIDFLNKRISRTAIFITQILQILLFFAFTATIISLIIFFLFTFLTHQSNISVEYFWSLFFGAYTMHVLSAVLGLVLGLFLDKAKGSAYVAGFAGFSWFLNGVSSIEGFPELLKYISPYYYFDTEILSQDYVLEYSQITLVWIFIFITSIIGLLYFRKKDIYL